MSKNYNTWCWTSLVTVTLDLKFSLEMFYTLTRDRSLSPHLRLSQHYTMRKWNDPDITLCNNETGASLCHLIMCLVSRVVSRVMLQITQCQVPTPAISAIASINDFLNQTLIGDSNCEKNTKYFHSYLFRTSDSQKLTDVVNQRLTLIYHHTK